MNAYERHRFNTIGETQWTCKATALLAPDEQEMELYGSNFRNARDSKLLDDLPRSSLKALPWDPNIGNRLTCIHSDNNWTAMGRDLVFWRSTDAERRPSRVCAQPFVTVEQLDSDLAAFDIRDVEKTSDVPQTLFNCRDPIQQLQSAPTLANEQVLLGTRTTTRLHLDVLGTQERGQLSLSHRFELRGSDLGTKAIADFALGGREIGYGHATGGGLIVDIEGSLWGWGLGTSPAGKIGHELWSSARPQLYRLRTGRKKGEAGYCGFARVIRAGANGNGALVGLRDGVTLHDIRSPTSAIDLVNARMLSTRQAFRASGPSSITSLLAPSGEYASAQSRSPPSVHVVATTRDVLWLDERMPGRDLLRFAHSRFGRGGKGDDLTMALQEVASGSDGVRYLALHSHLASTVTMFSSSSLPNEPIQMLVDPHVLTGNSQDPHDGSTIAMRAGLQFMHQATDCWRLYEVGVHGSLTSRIITLNADKCALSGRQTWNEEASQSNDGSTTSQDVQRRIDDDGVKIRGMDLRKARTSILKRVPDVPDIDPYEEWNRTLRQAVDSLLTSEQSPQTGILTLADLTSTRSAANLKREDSDDEADAVEAGALESLALPRTSAFPTLHPGNMAREATRKSSVGLWHECSRNLLKAPWTRRTSKNVSDHTLDGDDSAALETLSRNAQRLSAIYTGEDEVDRRNDLLEFACSEVALDTALSSQLLSTRAPEPMPHSANINGPQPPLDTPPRLHLSVCRLGSPRQGLGPDDEGDSDEESDQEQDTRRTSSMKSTGVRSILAEWQLATDPHDYTWTNLYINSNEVDVLASQSQTQQSRRKRGNKWLSSQAHSSQTLDAPPTLSAFSSQTTVAAPPAISSTFARPTKTLRKSRANIIGSPSSPWPSERAAAVSASQPVVRFADSSQPAQSEGQDHLSMQPSSPAGFHAIASQSVPGAFGSRDAFKKDKKKPKRQRGF
ncbi:hypothetical protein OIO90_000211 [Microbotryomycetes sp. JL221]|nr:hypothetical protein OIO90_000211 [Microbotryomycetes sp. JL221]